MIRRGLVAAAALLVAVGCSSDDRSAAPICPGAKLAVGVTAADSSTALSRGPAASSVTVRPSPTIG